jgi:hypothetical protein
MAEVLAPGSKPSWSQCRESWRNLRQRGDDEYKRCFIERVPKQASFAKATRQAQKLLSAALNAR